MHHPPEVIDLSYRFECFSNDSGAYDTTHNGNYRTDHDIFVTKLNEHGSTLVYSTFLGSNNGDVANGIALDRTGQVYVIGFTQSDGFPITAGAYDTTHNGNHRTDRDVFVTKLNEHGSDLVYSTFLGGTRLDRGRSIVVDNAERVYLTGYTDSRDFPTTAGACDETHNGGRNDVFITRFDFASPASSDNPNIVVPTPTDPNLLVPEKNDTTFVTGGSGPTACVFNSGAPLSIPLYVGRYVGPVNSDGTLENPTLLIDNHVVSVQARLRCRL